MDPTLITSVIGLITIVSTVVPIYWKARAKQMESEADLKQSQADTQQAAADSLKLTIKLAASSTEYIEKNFALHLELAEVTKREQTLKLENTVLLEKNKKLAADIELLQAQIKELTNPQT